MTISYASPPLTGGRPLRVGLDIGGTKVLGVLLAQDGTVVRQATTRTIRGRVGVVESAAQSVRGLLSLAGADLNDVESVGLGVPGLVDVETGVVSHAVNLGIGQRFGLTEAVSRELSGISVAAENDLNVAALGAAAISPEEKPDLAFLALGTGLAAGVVLDGVLRRGFSGAAGEIGHIPVRPDGPPCACGQHGCLELYASGRALAQQWSGQTTRPVPAELFDAASDGNPHAVQVRDEFAAAVAWAVRLLILTYDVKSVVIGGGVSNLGQPLLDAVGHALESLVIGSPFLVSLNMTDRISLVPTGIPVAAVGAAVAGRISPALGKVH